MLKKEFHDELLADTSNETAVNVRGIMLLLQLFGRTKIVCQNVPNHVIRSDRGFKAILNATHKYDAFAVISEVYSDYLELPTTRRNLNESFRNFEQRFEAQVVKVSCHSAKDSMLLEYLVAFRLMGNGLS